MAVTTYFSQSAGKDLVIREMAYPQLVNTINAYSRKLGGGTDETLDALRAELARRPVLDPNGAQPAAGAMSRDAAPARALPREAVMGDNRPPSDEPLKLRLEEDNAELLTTAANLEMQASKLPKEIETEDHLAEVNGWIVLAQNAGKTAESARKAEKEPFLRAGKFVDEFFGSIDKGLKSRMATLEQRKVPYLKAKRAREEAERAARAAELRRAQEEAEQRQRDERAAAAKAAAEAEAAAALLRNAATPEEMDAAEKVAREANKNQELAEAAVVQAGKDSKAAGKVADREEKILAGDHRHVLGKVSAGGASSALKVEYRPDVHNQQRMMSSLGPLGPFLGDAAIEAALKRAAKAEPRPAIPGVDYVEEHTASTRASRS